MRGEEKIREDRRREERRGEKKRRQEERGEKRRGEENTEEKTTREKRSDEKRRGGEQRREEMGTYLKIRGGKRAESFVFLLLGGDGVKKKPCIRGTFFGQIALSPRRGAQKGQTSRPRARGKPTDCML